MIATTDSFFTAIGDKTVIKAPSVRIVSYTQIRHPRSIGRRRVGIIITVPLSQNNKLGDYTGGVTKHVSNN